MVKTLYTHCTQSINKSVRTGMQRVSFISIDFLKLLFRSCLARRHISTRIPQNSSGALILTRTPRTISLKLQVSVKKLTFWSAHKNPALKVRLKVVSTGVEQLLQLFTAPTPKRSLLGLASARDTKKQAPGNLTRGTRGQAARR